MRDNIVMYSGNNLLPGCLVRNWKGNSVYTLTPLILLSNFKPKYTEHIKMAKKTNLSVHLFNCDNTFELDSVESLFTRVVRSELDFNISIDKHYFRLFPDVCDEWQHNSRPSDRFGRFCGSCPRISALNKRRRRWNWLREDLQSFKAGHRWVTEWKANDYELV